MSPPPWRCGLALAALATVTSGAGAAPVTVTGRITRADNRDPIAGATVEIKDNARRGSARAAAQTAADGRFQVTFEPKRAFVCEFSAPGMVTRFVNRTAANLTCDFALETSVSISPVTLYEVKDRGPGLAFTVSSAGIVPIAKVDVLLHVDKPSHCSGLGKRVELDVSGDVALVANHAGVEVATASRTLVATGKARLARCEATVVSLTINPGGSIGATPTDFGVTLPPTFRLHGVGGKLMRFGGGGPSSNYRSVVSRVDVDVHSAGGTYVRATRGGLSIPVAVAK